MPTSLRQRTIRSRARPPSVWACSRRSIGGTTRKRMSASPFDGCVFRVLKYADMFRAFTLATLTIMRTVSNRRWMATA